VIFFRGNINKTLLPSCSAQKSPSNDFGAALDAESGNLSKLDTDEKYRIVILFLA
jgi:hypothetical protein